MLILTQSDKRTKFDKEVELAEDGKHHSAIRRATKENGKINDYITTKENRAEIGL